MVNMPTTATWAYQGRVITSIKDMPEGTYGFIYEVIYKPTDVRYIGKKVLYFERNKRLGKKALKALQEERSKQGLRGRTPAKQKVISESDWKDYFGSQKEILTLSKKDNSSRNWEKRILQYVPTKKLLTYYETKYLFKNGILEDKYGTHINDNILGKFFRKDFD
jgi:hypothetical protein|tara:strand:+ start:1884 stop:2375 length:492 start_codon:yes stop_codon:yes gene_type:complete